MHSSRRQSTLYPSTPLSFPANLTVVQYLRTKDERSIQKPVNLRGVLLDACKRVSGASVTKSVAGDVHAAIILAQESRLIGAIAFLFVSFETQLTASRMWRRWGHPICQASMNPSAPVARLWSSVHNVPTRENRALIPLEQRTRKISAHDRTHQEPSTFPKTSPFGRSSMLPAVTLGFHRVPAEPDATSSCTGTESDVTAHISKHGDENTLIVIFLRIWYVQQYRYCLLLMGTS